MRFDIVALSATAEGQSRSIREGLEGQDGFLLVDQTLPIIDAESAATSGLSTLRQKRFWKFC